MRHMPGGAALRRNAAAALSEEYDEGVGAPVLVAETPVRVQWANQPTAPGGAPIDGAAVDGAAFSSKQEQLDYAVVRLFTYAPCVHPHLALTAGVTPQRTAVATYSQIGGPPPVAPRLAHRELVTYEDI
jgi:hypothetical protein